MICMIISEENKGTIQAFAGRFIMTFFGLNLIHVDGQLLAIFSILSPFLTQKLSAHVGGE